MRRKQYRVAVPDNHVGVELQAADGSWLSGRPTDLTIGGSGVRFSLEMLGEKCPDLALEDEVVLRFSAKHLAKPVVVSARVAHRADEGDARQFGLQFTARQQLDRELPPELFRLFNRRASFRVALEPDTVAVQIERTQGAPLTGTAIDLSATGIGIRVPPGDDYSEVDEIAIYLTLPNAEKPLDISGTMRHHRVVDDHAIIGIEFHDEDAAGHESVLAAFMMARQREMLRGESRAR